MGPTAERILGGVIPLVYGRRWLTFGLLLAFTAWVERRAKQHKAALK